MWSKTAHDLGEVVTESLQAHSKACGRPQHLSIYYMSTLGFGLAQRRHRVELLRDMCEYNFKNKKCLITFRPPQPLN